MNFEDLGPELKEKVKACKTAQEICDLAREQGYELSESELDQVSGGESWYECESYNPKRTYCTPVGH